MPAWKESTFSEKKKKKERNSPTQFNLKNPELQSQAGHVLERSVAL